MQQECAPRSRASLAAAVAGIPETRALALPCCLLLASGVHSIKEGGTCDKGRSLVAVTRCYWLSGAEDEQAREGSPMGGEN